MNFKRLFSMGIAAVMAAAAMSVTAMAKIPIYDNEGNIVAYEVTEDDVDDVNIGLDRLSQIPSLLALSFNPPEYSDTARDLKTQDYSTGFSLSSNGGIGYTNQWINSASKCGMRFYGVDDMRNLTMYIFKLKSSGKSTQVLQWTPSQKNTLGYTSLSLKSNYHYYIQLVNTSSSTLGGTVIVTNSPSDYGI